MNRAYIRWLRIAGLVTAVVALLAGVSLWCAYRAIRTVQPFYQTALDRDPLVLETAGQELERQLGALYSDVQLAGSWQTIFTTDQMNGWLAIELAENFPDLLPTNVWEPRVSVTPAALQIGYRTVRFGVETVVAVTTQVFLTAPDVVAIRILDVRAGAISLPVGPIATQVSGATRSLSYPVRWTQVDGDPVALVTLMAEDRHYTVETIELLDGEIYVAGRTSDAQVRAAKSAADDEDSIASVLPEPSRPPREVADAHVTPQSSRQ